MILRSFVHVPYMVPQVTTVVQYGTIVDHNLDNEVMEFETKELYMLQVRYTPYTDLHHTPTSTT